MSVKKVHDKLVRDRIPEIIRGNGGVPVTRVLDGKQYLTELVKKLKEEVAEFEADPFGGGAGGYYRSADRVARGAGHSGG